MSPLPLLQAVALQWIISFGILKLRDLLHTSPHGVLH